MITITLPKWLVITLLVYVAILGVARWPAFIEGLHEIKQDVTSLIRS